MADAVVINKVDRAWTDDVDLVAGHVRDVNPNALLVRAASPVRLGPGPEVRGRRVLVVEDGPSVTHGGMPYGAGTVAAQQAHAAELVDPRPCAVGSIAATFEQYPHLGHVLPAMGYSADQVEELTRTIRAVDCDVVVSGTPVDLERLVDGGHPIRRATYELEVIGRPDLDDVLAGLVRGL
jgi:predicted GTPase